MEPLYDFSRLGVMVVDDNPFMLQIVQAVLSGMRIKDVHTVADARLALKDLANWVPGIIFVDYGMAPRGGLKLIRAVRRSAENTRYFPIVLLTGYADNRIVRKARDIGADDTLTKPISLIAIYRTLVLLRERGNPFVEVGGYVGPDWRRRDRVFDGDDRRTEPTIDISPSGSIR